MDEISKIPFIASGKTTAELNLELDKATKKAERLIKKKNEKLKKKIEIFHKKWDSKHAISASGESPPVSHVKKLHSLLSLIPGLPITLPCARPTQFCHSHACTSVHSCNPFFKFFFKFVLACWPLKINITRLPLRLFRASFLCRYETL